MKKLNKKGFTLVELLAVIVILALLIVVVATTVLPAMNNAKKSALKTYADRVKQNAIQLCMTKDINEGLTDSKCTFDALSDIMGSDVDDTYTVTQAIVVTKEGNSFKVTDGSLKDKDDNSGTYSDNKFTLASE